MCLARRTVADAGGFDAGLANIEAVAAHHANNYMPLVAKHRRRDRATTFAFVRVVELEATSADRSVLDAVQHALAHAHLVRDFIPGDLDGLVVDLSFASEQWQRIVVDRDHPGQLNRRHFEACVFTYLAAELLTGAPGGQVRPPLRKPLLGHTVGNLVVAQGVVLDHSRREPVPDRIGVQIGQARQSPRDARQRRDLARAGLGLLGELARQERDVVATRVERMQATVRTPARTRP